MIRYASKLSLHICTYFTRSDLSTMSTLVDSRAVHQSGKTQVREGVVAEEITEGKLLLAEYERVTDEQRTRIRFRDSLVYTTLAAIAAVVAAAIQSRSNGALLMLPPVGVLLGWIYLVNDEKVSAIGRYIREEITPRVSALVSAPVFGWETAHRIDRRRRLRKVVQLGVDLSVFCGVPITALVVFWVTGPWLTSLIVVSIGESVMVVVLGVLTIMHADMTTAPAAVAEGAGS